jgi:hypothetical protein
MKLRTPKLTLVKGGKSELQHKKALLLARPWEFSEDEFEELCEFFALPRDEAFDLGLVRLAHQARTNHEAAVLFDILTGRISGSEIGARLRRGRFKLATGAT